MIRVNLFKRNNAPLNLLIGTLEMEKFNMPMYNTDIQVYKGLDNSIEFSIRNHDRKSVDMTDLQLNFVATNKELQQVIRKPLTTINAPLGRYGIILTKNELNDLDCGLYTCRVTVMDIDGSEEVLYAGTDWEPYFHIDLLPNKVDTVKPTITLTADDFIRELTTDEMDGTVYETFTSSMVKSDISSHHTLLLEVKDFLGTISVQGSNQELPEHNNVDWFDIKTIEYQDKDEETGEFIPYSGTTLINETLKCLNIRVQYKRVLDTDSIIEKVSYRN